jgi:hypothetical protein
MFRVAPNPKLASTMSNISRKGALLGIETFDSFETTITKSSHVYPVLGWKSGAQRCTLFGPELLVRLLTVISWSLAHASPLCFLGCVLQD